MNPRTKWFVGLYLNCMKKRNVFQSNIIPTEPTHGHIYAAVIGPFKTKRGARFMAEHGAGNPHCQTVRDAEVLAKLYTGDN